MYFQEFVILSLFVVSSFYLRPMFGIQYLLLYFYREFEYLCLRVGVSILLLLYSEKLDSLTYPSFSK